MNVAPSDEHRLEENEGMTVEQGIAEDRKQVLFLFNDVLKNKQRKQRHKEDFQIGKSDRNGNSKAIIYRVPRQDDQE